MFEVNGVYANRRGRYTVLKLNPPRMLVRFDDGTEAELKIDLQARIWENIRADFEAKEASRQARAAKRNPASKDTRYFIKVISVPSPTELAFAGWAERLILGPNTTEPIKLKSGDRIIFYSLETRTFFAVATITGEASLEDPKQYFFTLDTKEAEFFPIDIDATAAKLEKGAPVDSIDLESQPKFGRLRLNAEAYLEINEDDFELLSEALTEVVEEEEEEEEEEEDVYDEDDD